MYWLEGQLLNVFETPKGVTKEGEKYGGDNKIQVLHENTLKNGAKRSDLVELTVEDVSPYIDKIGHDISVPVSISVWNGKLSVKVATLSPREAPPHAGVAPAAHGGGGASRGDEQLISDTYT